jgi:hypothetical protein
MSNYNQPSVDLKTGFIAFRKFPDEVTTITLDMSGYPVVTSATAAVVDRGLVDGAATPLTVSVPVSSSVTRRLTFTCTAGAAYEDYIVYITCAAAPASFIIPITIKVESKPNAL